MDTFFNGVIDPHNVVYDYNYYQYHNSLTNVSAQVYTNRTFVSFFPIAWVASISFGLTFVFSPLSSSLCKRFGCKAVTTVGGILVGIGLLLSSFVDSIFRMYVTYSFLFGLGSSMCYVSSVLVLSSYFSKNLVVANGIGLAGAGVGTITLAPALSLLLDNYHWRDALRILSATSLLVVISGLIYYLVPAPMEFSDAEEYRDETKRIDFSFLKNKAYIVWIAVVGLVLFGFYIPYVHLVSELHREAPCLYSGSSGFSVSG